MEILETVNQYCGYAVNILLVVVLLVLIFVLLKVLGILSDVKKMMPKVDSTLDIVNDYLDEFKIPVRAIVNVSMSVEALRAATEMTIKNFADKMSENMRIVAEFLRQFWDNLSKAQKEETSEEATFVEVEKGE
ncbi:MAG: hypothetical protein HUJ58_07855 [Erysipelotrichaceae bacterium]|nr:hypothetical protein [Erysipelotrichaceae bacterium]